MSRKIAVVTGGTRGLGRALSVELAAAGYQVFAVWNRDPGAAADLSNEWGRRGLSGLCVRCDLGGAAFFEVPFQGEADEILLVHNAAAAFQPRPLHLLAPSDLEAQWSVAVRGFLLCTRALLRMMVRAGRSTVVAVTSRALAGMPPKGFSGYVAAKAGLAAMTQSLSVEYGGRGLRAFIVAPGFMRTSLTQGWDHAVREAVATSGESMPEDVARNIVRLVENTGIPARGESYDV